MLHLLGLWLFSSASGGWLSIIVYFVLNVAVLGFFYVSAAPKYDASGALISSGQDLSQKGLMDFLWDFIYVTWFCEVVTLFSAWLWLLMLIVRSFTASSSQTTLIKYESISANAYCFIIRYRSLFTALSSFSVLLVLWVDWANLLKLRLKNPPSVAVPPRRLLRSSIPRVLAKHNCGKCRFVLLHCTDLLPHSHC